MKDPCQEIILTTGRPTPTLTLVVTAARIRYELLYAKVE